MAAKRDEQLELPMSRLLQGGVVVSSLIMIIGGAIYLMRHTSEHPDYKMFHGVEPAFRSIGGILQRVREGSGRGLIQLGVLCMIATPVMRVAFAIYAFARERDKLYVGISTIVLALLLYGLVKGS
jgi:uncharacterized membrane protein